jgi:LEA14-like dessication related protein
MTFLSLSRQLRIAAIVLFVLGCVGLQPTREPPRVNLAGIAVKEVKSFETAFLVQLRVMNPNESAINVRGVDCELELNDKHFAAGVAGVEKTIPAYRSELVPVVLYSSVLDMANRVIGIIRSVQTFQKLEDLKYELNGKLRLGTASGSTTSKFNTRGALNLKELGTMKTKP